MAEEIEKKLPPKAPGKPPVQKVAPKQPPKPVQKPAKPEVAPKPVKPTKPTQPPKPTQEAKKVDANKPATPPKAPGKPQPNVESPAKNKVAETAPAKPEIKAPKPASKQEQKVAPKPELKTEQKVAPKQPPKPQANSEKAEKKPEKAKVENKKEEPLKQEAVKTPQKPEKANTKKKSEQTNPPQKPDKPEAKEQTEETSVNENSVDDNKNLNVVEKALSVEELNQRKQRRIRNATYAMSAVVLLLVIALIIIIFWPAEQRVEARYDLTFDSIPAVTTIEHSIYSEEVTGNIVTFKKNITIENPLSSSFAGYASFAVSVKFTDSAGNDISNKIYLRLDERNASDIYNLSNIKEATIGELENVPEHQIYVDLAKTESKYIYFTNVLAKGDDPYSIIVGFLAKEQSILNSEIKMSVTIYGFNAGEMNLTTTATGTQIRAANGQFIPATEEWINDVKENLEKRS